MKSCASIGEKRSGDETGRPGNVSRRTAVREAYVVLLYTASRSSRDALIDNGPERSPYAVAVKQRAVHNAEIISWPVVFFNSRRTICFSKRKR